MEKTTSRLRILILTSWALLIACVACTPRARTIQQYQKDGIRFTYYSDWKVVKDAPINGNANVRAIHIEGPNNAVVSLICEPVSSSQTLEAFASAVAAKRGEAIESKLSIGSVKTAQVSKGSSEPITGNVAGKERQGILQTFSIDLLGVQVPHEAKFYMVLGSRYKIMVMSQVSTEKAAATHAGSEMILSTLAIEGSS